MPETQLTSGTRLRCEQCGTEVIVLSAAAAVLTCCSAPMTTTSTRGSAAS